MSQLQKIYFYSSFYFIHEKAELEGEPDGVAGELHLLGTVNRHQSGWDNPFFNDTLVQASQVLLVELHETRPRVRKAPVGLGGMTAMGCVLWEILELLALHETPGYASAQGTH